MKPNLVFILTDQQRSDALGILGRSGAETPNLDMLARHGTLFTSAYSPCPSCIAARASIFTGQRPTTHGRIGYRDSVPWRYPTTLAGELARAGYQTHCVGKTHFFPQREPLGFESQDSYEAAQNFDGKYVNDYWKWLEERTQGRVRETDHGVDWNSWYARPSHLPEELHNNTWVVTKGIEFLERRDPSRPFFLNLSFHRPHPPIDPPQVFFDLFRDRRLPKVPVGDWAKEHLVEPDGMNTWRGKLPEDLLLRSRRAYLAQIAHIDNQIGRFLIQLRKNRKLDTTWIVFTSDHGEMLGDHGLFRKCYAYEGSAHVPLIVAPPSGSKIHTCAAPVSLEDLMPTFLEAASLPVPGTVEGRSLVPLCSSTPAAAGWREYVHGEHAPGYARGQGMQFLTDGKEKYIWFTLSGREQLFDLRRDPQELRDLSRVRTKRARLALWRARMVEELAARPDDGLSDGRRLIPGKELSPVRAALLS
ncbi:MAG: arylsulfatase [Verrucomicrobiae bacterium]|nr:arylsulfatase [Verrucomicrobiae bacterium]